MLCSGLFTQMHNMSLKLVVYEESRGSITKLKCGFYLKTLDLYQLKMGF